EARPDQKKSAGAGFPRAQPEPMDGEEPAAPVVAGEAPPPERARHTTAADKQPRGDPLGDLAWTFAHSDLAWTFAHSGGALLREGAAAASDSEDESCSSSPLAKRARTRDVSPPASEVDADDHALEGGWWSDAEDTVATGHKWVTPEDVLDNGRCLNMLHDTDGSLYRCPERTAVAGAIGASQFCHYCKKH
ncbi:MAG: hypothetical protein ACO32I_08915, partial [Candidatus Limnocylindrus sp.]